MTGTLHIVGLGPGGPEHRTPVASAALADAEVVVGYGPYLDQCADGLGDREVVRGRMGEEADRAAEALARARAGARVVLVSSGDAGVHGMAARTLALAAAIPAAQRPAVTVVPGVTAALAAAARIGAPLADDWATVSLSDLHVPWAVVERRLTGLALSGIALALYNPRSRRRTAGFDRALAILRAHRRRDTPVLVATDVARPQESIVATTLDTVDPEAVGMTSLVLVAGDTATWAGDWLVAERGAPTEAEAGAEAPAKGQESTSRGQDDEQSTPAPAAATAAREHAPAATVAPVPATAALVTFVGAGPGDPGLLTVAAAEAVRGAAVLVYDRPSMDAIVALAPADAQRHCVGRRSGGRALEQDEVNDLLVALAHEHGPVVRLKSGDPLVASRGGEEALALQRSGIATRVIPGVSAALAAPAAAGIPLHLRQLGVTATVVDGNDDDEHAEPPDWARLAVLGGTLVILTGRGRIRRTAAALMEHGLDPGTPVAAISSAARPQQRVLRGTLADLPAPLPPPVTFVVGAAAALDLTRPPEAPCTSPTAS